MGISKQSVTTRGILAPWLAYNVTWCDSAIRLSAVSHNMAATSDQAKVIAKALDSALGANILDGEDSNGIRTLIADYFASDSASIGDDAEQSEEESDNEEPHVLCMQEDHEHDEADDEIHNSTDSESDDGLVQTTVPNPQIDILCDATAPDSERQKVESFDCKCKLKTFARTGVSDSHSDSAMLEGSTQGKPGCIRQFSCDEVLARRMDMA